MIDTIYNDVCLKCKPIVLSCVLLAVTVSTSTSYASDWEKFRQQAETQCGIVSAQQCNKLILKYYDAGLKKPIVDPIDAFGPGAVMFIGKLASKKAMELAAKAAAIKAASALATGAAKDIAVEGGKHIYQGKVSSPKAPMFNEPGPGSMGSHSLSIGGSINSEVNSSYSGYTGILNSPTTGLTSSGGGVSYGGSGVSNFELIFEAVR